MTQTQQPTINVGTRIAEALRARSAMIQTLLPNQNIDTFISIVVRAVVTNEYLASCVAKDQRTFVSLVEASLKCAEVGLMPNGIQAAFVPMRKKDYNTVAFMPMWKGLVDIGAKYGITFYQPTLVYESEVEDGSFVLELGVSNKITHKPKFHKTKKEKGDWILVYAVAEMPDGRKNFIYLERWYIEEIKAVSKSKNTGISPWDSNFDEMAKKTAIRRLYDLLPKSKEMLTLMQADDAIDHEERKAPVVIDQPKPNMALIHHEKSVALDITPQEKILDPVPASEKDEWADDLMKEVGVE